MGGRFVEGRSVEGRSVEGCFVGRTFCSGGRFVEGRFVLVPNFVETVLETEGVRSIFLLLDKSTNEIYKP